MTQQTREQRNERIIREFYDESHKGNLSIYDTMFTPDFISHGSGAMQDLIGAEAFKQALVMYTNTFPDFRTHIELMICEGDYVMVWGPAEGTFKGAFMGIPPNGEKITWTGAAIYRLNDEGKIAERWQELNAIAMMQQMGAIPPSGGVQG